MDMWQLKSERHHWWPTSLSNFWCDAEGFINCVSPTGKTYRSTPINIGVIRDGHAIKFANIAGQTTPFDQSFESEFQKADDTFANIIPWLQKLPREARIASPCRDRFQATPVDEERIRGLIEALVSLAVRSPMNRKAAVSLAEELRGPIRPREREALIGLNLRDTHRRVIETFGLRGKIAVIYSPNREFIYGDGFFHNVVSGSSPPTASTIVAPLTPEITVLYAARDHFVVPPKLMTVVISAEEAQTLNNAVQVYACNQIFYRNEKPDITEEYRRNCHLKYEWHSNPIEQFIERMSRVE